MKRCPLALLFASTAVAVAQPLLPPATPAPVAAPGPAQPRAVSSGTADLLKAALPKSAFVKPPEKKSDAAAPDLRDTDKPRNDIVRLPNYVVREPKPPVFREQDIYTPQAFARRLAKRYYSEGYLAFDRLFHFIPFSSLVLDSAEGYAMAKFQEEERLRVMAELAGLMPGEKVKEIFMRPSDFGWQGGKPK